MKNPKDINQNNLSEIKEGLSIQTEDTGQQTIKDGEQWEWEMNDVSPTTAQLTASGEFAREQIMEGTPGKALWAS